MRVLFTPRAGGSPYHLMVPLAWSLRNAGHEVRVAGPPGLVDTITDSGLPAVAIEGACADLDPLHAVEAAADDLVDFVRAWQPELVIHSPDALAGPLAAAVAGAPGIRFLEGFDVGAETVEQAREHLGRLCARFGAGECDPAGALSLDPRPPALADPAGQQATSLRHVPYHGPGVVPDWLLDQDRPARLCVCSDEPLPAEALAELDAEVVTSGPADQAGGARVLDTIPLNLLLSACDGIIHHGAADVTLTAAALGLPQLILPRTPREHLLAERVAAAGAASLLLPDQDGAPALRARAAQLLSAAGLRDAARRLRDEIGALPSPVEMAEIVANLGAATPSLVSR